MELCIKKIINTIWLCHRKRSVRVAKEKQEVLIGLKEQWMFSHVEDPAIVINAAGEATEYTEK